MNQRPLNQLQALPLSRTALPMITGHLWARAINSI